MLNLNVFSHKHHLSSMRILTKYIRRVILGTDDLYLLVSNPMIMNFK